MLMYYDSQLDRIEQAKSRDLFAESELHSEQIERRLQELHQGQDAQVRQFVDDGRTGSEMRGDVSDAKKIFRRLERGYT